MYNIIHFDRVQTKPLKRQSDRGRSNALSAGKKGGRVFGSRNAVRNVVSTRVHGPLF
jgi:hypothetical protein